MIYRSAQFGLGVAAFQFLAQCRWASMAGGRTLAPRVRSNLVGLWHSADASRLRCHSDFVGGSVRLQRVADARSILDPRALGLVQLLA